MTKINATIVIVVFIKLAYSYRKSQSRFCFLVTFKDRVQCRAAGLAKGTGTLGWSLEITLVPVQQKNSSVIQLQALIQCQLLLPTHYYLYMLIHSKVVPPFCLPTGVWISAKQYSDVIHARRTTYRRRTKKYQKRSTQEGTTHG